ALTASGFGHDFVQKTLNLRLLLGRIGAAVAHDYLFESEIEEPFDVVADLCDGTAAGLAPGKGPGRRLADVEEQLVGEAQVLALPAGRAHELLEHAEPLLQEL